MGVREQREFPILGASADSTMVAGRVSHSTVQMIFQREGFWRAVLGIGIAWMMLGMVVMPSGVSFNPGRIYQTSLIVLLYIPALCLAGAQRGAMWRTLLPLPIFRIFLLLLAWAALSLLWAHLHRPGDELGRLLSVLAFVLGWQVWVAGDERRGNGLLLLAGLGIALFALGYCTHYLLDPPQNDRIVGEGVIATSNYAAGVMGAACVWLSQLLVRARGWSMLRWLAVLVLLVFVGLTQTRSVWLALAVCVVLAPLWCSRRAAKWLAVAVLLAILIACMWPWDVLLDRGASLRPQLFMQSLHLIGHQPWLGLGQGAPFTLMVAGVGYIHSHNVLTQAAIELGLPGLVLMVTVWLMVGWQGWRHRQQTHGRLLLAMWVYASVALQFDMPQLLDSPRPSWLLIWLPFALALGLAMRERINKTSGA